MQIREEEQCFCVGAINALQHQLSPAVANCNRDGVTIYIQTDLSATVIHEGAPCCRELWFDSPSTYSTGRPIYVSGDRKPQRFCRRRSADYADQTCAQTSQYSFP